MANEEHLAILRQGVAAWNAWRKDNPDVQPDLHKADLEGVPLANTLLREANLREANLQGAYLEWADLRGASLQGVDLEQANLKRMRGLGANLEEANLKEANLEEARPSSPPVLLIQLSSTPLYPCAALSAHIPLSPHRHPQIEP
jgi:uncharacterized protein YjbI with pentapeptide repeats